MRTETGRAFLFLTGSPQCYAVGPWGEFLGTSISGKLSDGIECFKLLNTLYHHILVDLKLFLISFLVINKVRGN